MSSTSSPPEREVIDPISHLPVHIHDNTSQELEQVPPFSLPESDDSQSFTGDSMRSLVLEEARSPRWADYSQNKLRTQATYHSALAGIIGCLVALMVQLALTRSFGINTMLLGALVSFSGAIVAAASALYFGLSKPVPSSSPGQKKNECPERQRDEKTPESALWLNFVLHSVWPIINPALFIPVSDMLEDSLQASLPTMIKAVRVAELGQGSEPLRILGIRGMHAGEADKDKGELKAEEGDFVNLEVSVGYRARPSANNLKEKSRNIHLLVQLWTAGRIMIPIWAEIEGIIAIARVRLQLTPNPPFFAQMTLTFLGLPRITLKCTPLSKRFFNVMDIPVLSKWLQQSIDSAVGAYIAPRSLNLDLKTMLTGREKLDTDAIGVIFVDIHSAKNFRDGDGGKMWQDKEKRRGDVYVTLGWGKLGKPIWSTRIIQDEGNPIWDEPSALIVSPADVDAQERVQLQLWDSDRFTADDLLGSVEVPLEELMHGKDSWNRMSSREDSLKGQDGKPCDGTLIWSCGFFEKTTLHHHLEDAEEVVKNIKNEAAHKLREAQTTNSDQFGEAKQQQAGDVKEKTDELISGSPPSAEWPSGILSVRVISISGLEVQKVRESGVKSEGESEENDDLPSAYCTIIINHEPVFKTRTKMKTSQPYYDAGIERFIKDWQRSAVFIAVRDARVHEGDALLGVVVLRLSQLFRNRSQILESFPLVGGVGYGRARISLIFRNVQAKIPRELLGWNIGTLEIQPHAHASDNLPHDLRGCRILCRTLWGKGKMLPRDGHWAQRRESPIRLPVIKRYGACLLIQFKRYSLGPDTSPAFCTLWLRHVSDDEETEVALPVRKGDSERARFNATDDTGECIGTLHITVRLYPGLSGYHKNVQDPAGNLRDVMEMLDCAEEAEEVHQDVEYEEHGDSSSSSSSSEDESTSTNLKEGAVGEALQYRVRKDQLHRKHRGLMQWSGIRKLAWVANDVEETADKTKQKARGLVKHQDKNTGGIDKEV